VAVATPTYERAAGRRKLAKKKQALGDGSFPIPNVSYLGKAIRAVGRAAPGKRLALARLIRKRARQLGSAGMAKLKGSWADPSKSTKQMARALYDQLVELSWSPEDAKASVSETVPYFVLELNRQNSEPLEYASKMYGSAPAGPKAKKKTATTQKMVWGDNEILTFDLMSYESEESAFMFVLSSKQENSQSPSSPETPIAVDGNNDSRKDRHIGHFVVGQELWAQMKQQPRKQITKWHKLY